MRRVRTLLLGLTLGLGAGVAPGPLLALVLSATLERGFWAGARVAVVPLVTDAPIVAVCLLVLDALPAAAVAALSIGGGGLVVALGAEQLRAAGRPPRVGVAPRREMRRAALVNVVSPHPWLFWIGAGGPLVLDAGSVPLGAAFLIGFYASLVGAKLAVAALLAAGRRRLAGGRGYAVALRVAGVLLVAAGVVLAVSGVRAL